MTGDDLGTMIRTRAAERMHKADPVDGIICASTTAAISVVAALEKTGLTTGVESDVFAKEAVELLGFVRETILTVIEDIEAAGRFLQKLQLSTLTAGQCRR